MMNHTLKNHPKVALIRQKLFRSDLDRLAPALTAAFSRIELDNSIKPGQTVAVAVGSRGIGKIDRIVHLCLEYLKSKGLTPYIVPAMGSHGGATAKGQEKVLDNLGISRESMGVPIHPDMEVASLGKLRNDVQIFFSRQALNADHIVAINRIKPHTKFRAEIESGLSKMLTIGLGKAKGAAEYHRKAITHSFGLIEDAAQLILKKNRVLFGLAVLEDGYGSPAHIEALLPDSLIRREKELLVRSSAMMGRIPFNSVDILIIDYFGKNISGIGMDSNVTGRHRDIVGDFYINPHVRRVFVRDLAPESDGNANGIGLADFTTKRLVEAMDYQKTYINAMTAISPEKAAIPLHFDNDLEAVKACASTTGLESMEHARLVRIRDTAHLELLQVSRAFAQEVSENSDLEQLTPWEALSFDSQENLSRFPDTTCLPSHSMIDE